MALLDKLFGEQTRFVTRSVANHLNGISKTEPDVVLERLSKWNKTGAQDTKELGWMARHALRTLVKSGHAGVRPVRDTCLKAVPAFVA